ncbi:polyadenylate binding protein [Anaeramoeba ignava]|uniref:Polyadenylate binding protein n=1 Tax=Anaeramoeba ignava TaxID=1746090 RepID=A0A9Q0RDK5_ANAIG|nr:polyadenylate binding protein [Anaeramoeba ignava]
MTEEEIETEFKLPKNGRPAGFAFVEMKNIGGAKKVVDELNGIEVSGRTIRVELTQFEEKDSKQYLQQYPQQRFAFRDYNRGYFPPMEQDKNIITMNTEKSNPIVYIGNLPLDVTEEEIETEFGKFAEVVNVRIAQKRGRPAGFAFVEMKNIEGAKKVVDKLDGTEVSGRTIRVELAQFEEKDSKQYPQQYPQQRFAFRDYNRGYFPPMSFVPYPRYSRYSQFSSFSPTRKPQQLRRRRRQSRTPKEESKTQIHVSNLPFNMEDEEFEKIFQNFKTKECKIARLRNGKSKGFGFVEFESNEDQQKALELNEKEFGGRKIGVRVAYVPNQRELSKTRIHVSNLPFNMKDEEFEKIFQNFKTKECKIARTKIGKSKGFGFVEFESHEDQQKSLELNKKEIDGRKIEVKIAYVSAPKEESTTQIYVSNIPFEMEDEEFEKIFQNFKTKECKIARFGSGRSKEFGFVEFESHEDQQKALELNHKEFGGRKIGVKIADVQNLKEFSKTRIHVSNIPFEMEDEEFEKIFQNFKTKECKISRFGSGRSKEFGFVEFESHEDQQKALELNHKEFNGRKIGVKIAFELPKKNDSD